MKMTRLLFLGILCLMIASHKSFAQSTPVASGGEANGSGGTASYSLGEVAYTTITSNQGIIIQGVQQAYTPADLPISLLEFKATVTDKKEVSLTWTTVSEHNNQYFTVERSKDGETFVELQRVDSKGNSVESQEYEAADNSPLTGTSYYRLKQTDNNGTFTYSKTVAVSVPASDNELTAYPNPSTTILNLQIKDAATKKLTYSLYSIDGKLISQQPINNDLTVIPTSTLVNGIYLLQVKDNNKSIKSFKIIKN